MKPTDRDKPLLRAGKLKPEEVLRAANVVRVLVKNHHRRSHRWCWNTLGISKRLFYRFLAVSRWSKKVKKLIQAHPAPLSQTVLFKLADQKWKDARQLFNKLEKIIVHLAKRKRRGIRKLKNASDRVGAYLQSMKENPLQKKFKIVYQAFGRVNEISTVNLERSIRFIQNSPGFQYIIYPKRI